MNNDFEYICTLVKVDPVKKVFICEQKMFVAGSEEAKKAKTAFTELYLESLKNGYKIDVPKSFSSNEVNKNKTFDELYEEMLAKKLNEEVILEEEQINRGR